MYGAAERYVFSGTVVLSEQADGSFFTRLVHKCVCKIFSHTNDDWEPIQGQQDVADSKDEVVVEQRGSGSLFIIS